MDKNYENTFDEKKKQVQLEFIQKQIIEGNNKDHFLVINAEAGSGKTRQMEKALAELYKINPTIKTLVVQRFKDTAKEKEGNICTSHTRINKYVGREIAIAVDSDNYKKVKEDLNRYPVVIITHERYKILSKYKRERRRLIEGRRNLIIDEEINILNIYEYNLKRINIFSSFLENEIIKKQYINCITPIVNYLKNKDEDGLKFNLFELMDIESNLKELKDILEANITEEYAKKYHRNQLTGELDEVKFMTKAYFLNEVYILKQIYNNIVLLYKNSIYTFDSNIQYWLLDNNIILDANGGFNKIYKLSSMFKCTNQAKVSDHKNWDIIINPIPTSKNAKKKYLDFNEKIEAFIKENVSENDKALVVGNKEDEKKFCFTSNNIMINHHGNLLGRNDYRDFNIMFDIYTLNLPPHVYILKYLFYGGNCEGLDVSQTYNNRVMCFKDRNLEAVRATAVASELYQSIKRINRNMEIKEKNTKACIFSSDKKAVDIVIKELKNCNVIVNEFTAKKERGKYDDTSRNIDSHRTHLAEYLENLDHGKYKKKNIRDELGISKTHFSKLLKNVVIIEMLNKRGIKIDKTQFITVPKEKEN